MNRSTLNPSYRAAHRAVLPRAALCSRALRLRSREVDGWYLIVGSLVRGYTG